MKIHGPRIKISPRIRNKEKHITNKLLKLHYQENKMTVETKPSSEFIKTQGLKESISKHKAETKTFSDIESQEYQ